MYIQYVEFYGILSVRLLPEDRKTDIHMCEPERVSVIVPVFNVEEYLEEALDSLLMQTYRNLEILVVDDGSTDGSGEICDAYAMKDERIRVVHQENQGLSGARNTALDLMTGDFVMFLDPDDAYHPEMVQRLVETQKMEQADIVLCRFVEQCTQGKMNTEIVGGSSSPIAPAGCYNRQKALCALAEGKINISVWNKLYLRELWEGVSFPVGHVYEDLVTTYRITNRIRKMILLEDVLYQQRIRPGAITKTITEKNIQDKILSFDMQESYIHENIKGVFTEKQWIWMKNSKLSTLIDMYSRYIQNKNYNKMYGETLRQYIIQTQKGNTIQTYRIHIRFLYLVLRTCPRMLKMIYPGYLMIKNVIHN